MSAEADRVSLGASLLDDCAPPGWARRIDTRILHLGSDNYGILGQIYGTYWRGLDALFPNARSGAAQQRLGVLHGYWWDLGHSLDPEAEAAALEYAWGREIAERRSAPAVKPVQDAA